ncbi:hypothetical protein Pla22_03400 [Rubripirellula amarantea]|uniref:General secretion pathway protein K n=1 Tax=Rubripirellula amarantea TaxID=2527999 RepID=A0A5C5WPD5_9BACT|nr:hypothetical protein [Rubripirellula amarantea]TWT52714.1 hypothetical protein Pla22_03400 [Rubripirellula amarantea]
MQTDFTLSQTHQRHGYVLLVVIAVCIVVVTVLSSLAKISLRASLDAADAERSLQKRWGQVSLERAMLPSAALLFQQLEESHLEQKTGPPPKTVRSAITLGNITFDVLLGDEDAKLNLNALYHHTGLEKTQRSVETLTGPNGRQVIRLLPSVSPQQISRESVRLSLRDDDADDETAGPPNAFRSWGEVFDLSNLQRLTGSPIALPNVTTEMTCWGNGQLNLRRASDESILAVVSSVVQDAGAKRLLKRFRQSPTISMDILLLSEVSNPNNRDKLTRLLSETSTNFSIWISASSTTDRDRMTFSVTQRDDDGTLTQSRFAL